MVRRLFKEKGIQGAWDGKVPNLKRLGSKKKPGGFGRRPGLKTTVGGRKVRPARNKTKPTLQS